MSRLVHSSRAPANATRSGYRAGTGRRPGSRGPPGERAITGAGSTSSSGWPCSSNQTANAPTPLHVFIVGADASNPSNDPALGTAAGVADGADPVAATVDVFPATGEAYAASPLSADGFHHGRRSPTRLHPFVRPSNSGTVTTSTRAT
jgi:hypothetical protein